MIEKSKLKVGLEFTFSKLDRFIWFPKFMRDRLDWKDKFGCPRVDHVPEYHLCWGFWQISLIKGNDLSWEFYFWINEWHDGDLQAAIETWPYKRLDPPVNKPKTML